MIKKVQGLIRLRKHTASKPEYNCDNCGCNRYSPCNCMKRAKSK